jgi:DNA-binding beta-propeller fold protein YncE
LAAGWLIGLAVCAAAASDQDAGAAAVFPAPPAQARYRFERTIYGSKDVLEQQGNGALLRFLNKEDLSSGPGLSSPHAIAVDHGRVFVTNFAEGRVNVFDIPGRRFYSIGDGGPGMLQKPLGLSVDRAGRLYVADGLANAVLVYDPQGKYLSSIGGPSWFVRLIGVTADPDGSRLYAIDAGARDGSGTRVRVFDPRDGSHLLDFGAQGSEPGEFNLPTNLALDRTGLVYVMDSGNYRVQVFDRQGTYLRSFGSAGKPPGRFGRPKAIAIDADGNINVVDALFGGILVFDPSGAPQYAIGGRGDITGAWSSLLPVAIAIDADGSLYCLDQGYRKIDVLRPLGVRRSGPD